MNNSRISRCEFCSMTKAIFSLTARSSLPFASTIIPLGRMKSGLYVRFFAGTTYCTFMDSYSKGTLLTLRHLATFFSNWDLSFRFFSAMSVTSLLHGGVGASFPFPSPDPKQVCNLRKREFPLISVLLLVQLLYLTTEVLDGCGLL